MRIKRENQKGTKYWNGTATILTRMQFKLARTKLHQDI